MMADYPGHHVHHQRHLKRSSTVASTSSSSTTGSNLMQPPTSSSATTTTTPSRQAFVQRAYEHHRRRLTERDDDADATDVDFDDDDDDDEDDEEGDVDDEDDSLREHCGRLLSSNQNKHLLVSNEASPNHGQATPATAAAAVALFADLMASNPSVPATQLLGGSFQFIVQEQAKSMVAIQELQQEVNSLLLFRQAVLAALPHLTPVATSSNPAPPSTKSNQTWTRRKHLQQQQHTFSSLNQQQADQIVQTTTAAAAAATSTQHHQIVVDSGFSTEASNASNTSPRSSRFETGDAAVQPAAMMAQPGEKELVQHLERIQQRQARLKKDEDRLLALLNVPPKKPSAVGMAPSARHEPSDPHDDDDGDELWRLLDEIQLKSQTLREDGAASSKKKVSFQQVDASTNTDTDNDPMLAIEEKLPKLDGASGKMKLDREQVAAVLRLTNPVQLQKQLLCALLDNKKLKAQVETNRSESARRDAQWQTNSQSVADQVTALRDENDDLRFQLEEQKIELEGTKARLRMVTLSSKPLGGAASANSSTSPALTTVRMRASSTQTERSPAYHQQQQQHAAPKWSQSTQTTTDNNHEEPVPRPRSFVPRVIDASPKPRASGKFDQGQWVHEEEDRPSVERRSYTSRIPTPIKPTVIPIVSSPSSYSSGTKWTATSNGVSSPSVRRELPDTPPTVAAAPPTSAKKRLEKDVPQTILMTPVQKSRSSPIVHATSERTRNSPEANNNNNHKMRLSSSSSRRGGLGDCTNTRAPHDEYYDSINANNHQHCPRNARIASPMLKKNRSHNYGPPSPVDSLESNGPYHHYRGVAVAGADSKLSSSTKRGSYSTESSTPPSNSLTSHS